MEKNIKELRIAALITCHNRKDKTVECLRRIGELGLPENLDLDIYLVDDGSSDGTEEVVRNQFPSVNLIKGTGELFWNGGMRLAWRVASQGNDYEYYLWINDDTYLEEDALVEMLLTEKEAIKKNYENVIVVGACMDDEQGDFSYGGRSEEGDIVPDGEIRECVYMNGNCVLVPKTVFDKVGNLSSKYTHICGDFDYGLRAIERGCKLVSSRKYVARCSRNAEVRSRCFDGGVTLLERFREFNSGKKFNKNEYKEYLKDHKKKEWRLLYLKAYLRMLAPELYKRNKQYFG